MGSSAAARARLVRLLQDAHAGELAAAYAYRGHWRSLASWRPGESAEIRRIEEGEWHHRRLVASMLVELGAGPRWTREVWMWLIGRFFGALCWVGGWFGPMYAAGRLEAQNVGEYERALADATALGLGAWEPLLVEMIAEEDRHERWFGDRVRGHRLLGVAVQVWGWRPPD